MSSRTAVVALVALTTLLAGTLVVTPDEARSKRPGLAGDYVGQTPPGAEPALFAPGFVSTGLYERDVAMTPDGGELYFGLLSGGYATIVVTRRTDGQWSEPEIAPFSTNSDYLDLEPHITPDGTQLLFLSTRPREGQEYQPGWANQDIWAVDRQGDGWGEPYNIGSPVSTDAAEFYPSVTRDGTIYFTRDVNEEGTRKSFIFRSRFEEGGYTEPVKLPEQVNPTDTQYNAFIDPDERYLIVCISGLPDAIGRGDYYACFRGEDDTWTGPVNLGDKINTPGNSAPSPYVSPDGKYFFFASTRRVEDGAEPNERRYDEIKRQQTEPGNGGADIYWVDASFIETLRP